MILIRHEMQIRQNSQTVAEFDVTFDNAHFGYNMHGYWSVHDSVKHIAISPYYVRTFAEAVIEFLNVHIWQLLPQVLVEQIDLSPFMFLMWAKYNKQTGAWHPLDTYTDGAHLVCYPTMCPLQDVMAILAQIGLDLLIKRSSYSTGVESV